MKWNGSTSIITGASRGIGRAVAIEAAKRGARVGLLARSKDDLSRVLEQCGGKGSIAICDVADQTETTEAIASIERELGPTDILVNNAGLGAYGTVEETAPDTFEHLMKVNYLGTVYPTKAVLPGMIARGRGAIVNVASIAGRIGAPLEAAYSATKFAVAGFTEALAMEVHPKGISVSMVSPGPVATDFFNARGAPYKRKFPKQVSAESVARAIIKSAEGSSLERFVPRWLRYALAFKVIAPPAYRVGAQRDFRDELR